MMERKIFNALLYLLLVLCWMNVADALITDRQDLLACWGLPEGLPTEPEGGWDPALLEPPEDIDEAEGDKPLYVLVFGDEEERAKTYGCDELAWDDWAALHIERGDRKLVEWYGIDIRILGFEEWDSDDSITNMWDMFEELESDTSQFLNQYYAGEWWDDIVDAIIGITDQVPPNPAGLASPPEDIALWRIFTLLNWQYYWSSDNLVQHEISHLYQADDHFHPCCAMAYKKHWRDWVYEDGRIWWVSLNVYCSYLTYKWCDTCNPIIEAHDDWYHGGGQTCPILSVYDGTGYVEEGTLDIHNPEGEDIITEHVLTCTPQSVEGRYLMRLTEHNQTNSHIDQVKLLAIHNGVEIPSALVSAVHSADGDVLEDLRHSDDVRVDTAGADHNNGISEYIDLKFVAPEGLEIDDFIFVIEGHNIEFKT